jgi:hypothetical protein
MGVNPRFVPKSEIMGNGRSQDSDRSSRVGLDSPMRFLESEKFWKIMGNRGKRVRSLNVPFFGYEPLRGPRSRERESSRTGNFGEKWGIELWPDLRSTLVELRQRRFV